MDAETDKRITIAAVLLGHPKEALLFVLSAWSPPKIFTQTHIDGVAFCWRLHDYALHLYGPDARKQLKEWGIETTSDFGKIVFGLVEHGFIRTTESDDLNDFKNVFEFEAHFVVPKAAIRKQSHQWMLSTIFVVTTLAAIATLGFSRNGLNGIVPALTSAWFASLGLGCITVGITSRSPGWLFLSSFGLVSLAAGLFAFFTYKYG